eukprot:TRINITY_DN5503_c0_g3_i1.p1 TRINITY_DN5503_c0_g3~~TRINITY_DN5503_c0_g3_i1.p1  ORF type:complete len:985 (-),score=157.67 TRINITY_DN5503_c0_g3_i1:568-3522(-)
MCSFLATSWLLTNLTYVNFFLQTRGPDHTSKVTVNGMTFVHNLLHMTGDRVVQPFLDDRGTGTSFAAAVYNGEVYNYRTFAEVGGAFKSDGESLLPVYRRYGVTFPRVLDGEFAVAVFDWERGLIVLATDVFSTKPLWFSAHDGFHVASYESGLLRLGIPTETIRMVDPNTIMVFNEHFDVIQRHAVREFDLRQFKTHTKDFQAAFEAAVQKRTRDAIYPVFIGLSSGYDSGAIQVSLVSDKKQHYAYTVYSTEDVDTLKSRIAWAGDIAETNIIVLSGHDVEVEAAHLAERCEPYHYRATRGQEFLVSQDPASFGLSYIFREVRRRGILVYLSGTGADEIISDYGHGGKKIFPHSNFGGFFPDHLQELFPWESFFLGTQRDYLMKEEMVAGVHGVEARYPFLDPSVVQEFLWLAPEVKNAKYKAPVDDLLRRFGYPFRSGEKLGFNAAHNVRWEDQNSVFVTHHARQTVTERNDTNTPEGSVAAVDRIAKTVAASSAGNSFSRRELELQVREEELQASEKHLAAVATQLEEKAKQLRLLTKELVAERENINHRSVEIDASWRRFKEQVGNIQEQQRAQHESALRFMALRLIPIRHIASTADQAAFPKIPLAAPSEEEVSPSLDEFDTRHSRWSGVEIITCASGGRFLNVMDFPVYQLFRASTPLPVHNLCENIEWEGMHMRLRMYRRFLGERLRSSAGGRERLFIVSDGMDVIFNDLSAVLERDDVSDGLSSRKSRSVAVASEIIRRYEAVLADAGQGEVVFSSERLCGWGGGFMCSEEDVARYPEAPTDSRFLNAGGYIGPAASIDRILASVLDMVERAKKDTALGLLRAKTDAQDSAGGETDQYFFKLFFWEHPDVVVLDYRQAIFGNFLEVERKECGDGWKPRCAFEPCCTVSDSFRRFNEVFYGNYEVRNCAIWRQGQLPISWHGNGAGKWLWLIALEELSRHCGYAASLFVEQYPVDPIERLFDSFDVARIERQRMGS